MEVKNQNSKWIPGKLIGKGSYGLVRLGSYDGEGEPAFAVKSAEKNSVSSIEALENEIDILSSLSSSSPFIVDYYGEEETTLSRNLFMEYINGGDLSQLGKVDDVELIRSYTWCLVSAVREIHGRNIVHCDIKGSNVLVGPTKGVVKIADFGSAKRAGLDNHTVPRGSPLWMAPEVVCGESQSYESDVWSIGCTVIEMFTGKPAWQDNGAHTLYQIGYSNELPECPAQLPELARDFLGNCLSREPRQRWSCDQLLQHPFLVPAPSVGDHFLGSASPRSVFDWESVNFFDDVETTEDEVVLARGRIGELATLVGVNWESDGWVEVRKGTKDCENGIITLTTPRVNWELHSDDEDSTWINLSVENDDVEIDGGGEDGERCGHGCLIGRQMIKSEKNITYLITKFWLLMLNLSFALYFSASVGLPRVSELLLFKLIRILCFWNKFIFLTYFCYFACLSIL